MLNVSAVLWRRTALLAALDRCGDELAGYSVAGDWRVYVEVLTEPGATVAYVATPLNLHRRHAESVTHRLDGARLVDEIARLHKVIQTRLGPDKAVASRQANYLRSLARRPRLLAAE